MTVSPFRATVGASRIGKGLDSTTADFTRSVRSQMQAVIKQYVSWVDHLDDMTDDILYDALLPTFELSQDIVPVKSGNLRASGYLEKGKNQVEIGYAKGGYPDYAVIVHENPDLHHKEPTQYKFLQTPLEHDWPNVQERIIHGLRVASGMSPMG